MTPKEFYGLGFGMDFDGYVPLNMNAPDSTRPFWTDRAARTLITLGRLKAGVSLKEARAAVNLVAARLAEEYPATDRGSGIEVIRGAVLEAYAQRLERGAVCRGSLLAARWNGFGAGVHECSEHPAGAGNDCASARWRFARQWSGTGAADPAGIYRIHRAGSVWRSGRLDRGTVVIQRSSRTLAAAEAAGSTRRRFRLERICLCHGGGDGHRDSCGDVARDSRGASGRERRAPWRRPEDMGA